jgi:hypothetical protein
MALIENLEQNNWQEMLRMYFKATLDILQTDPHASAGSSVDDLRAWLRTGGVNRVLENLDKQMQARRFSEEKKMAVMHFMHLLLQENRLQLVQLAGQTTLPINEQAILSANGISQVDVPDLLNRIMRGERPFEDWMHKNGHSEESISRVYQTIDAWLIKQGMMKHPKSMLH